jgi:hypothetical protein
MYFYHFKQTISNQRALNSILSARILSKTQSSSLSPQMMFEKKKQRRASLLDVVNKQTNNVILMRYLYI